MSETFHGYTVRKLDEAKTSNIAYALTDSKGRVFSLVRSKDNNGKMFVVKPNGKFGTIKGHTWISDDSGPLELA